MHCAGIVPGPAAASRWSRALRAAAALAILASAAPHVARAADPPQDPWRDPEWQVATHALAPASVRAIRFTEALYTPASGTPRAFSTRDARLEFDAQGRLSRLTQTRMQDFGPARTQRLAYVYDGAGRLERIEEDGGGRPVFERRFDATGRLVESGERQGVLWVHTRIDYDSAGREIERSTDDGFGKVARLERRRYRPDGTPLSVEQRTPGLAGYRRTVAFDTRGRPREIVVNDTFDHATTTVEYPDALTAIWRTRGFAATRDAIGRYRSEVRYTVRDPAELRRPEPPEEPVVRIESNARGTTETRTEFDADGRPLRRRHYGDNGALVCVESVAPDAFAAAAGAGPSAAADGPTCNGSANITVATERNGHGHWTRQVFTAHLPDGRHLLLSEQTREIEYR